MHNPDTNSSSIRDSPETRRKRKKKPRSMRKQSQRQQDANSNVEAGSDDQLGGGQFPTGADFQRASDFASARYKELFPDDGAEANGTLPQKKKKQRGKAKNKNKDTLPEPSILESSAQEDLRDVVSPNTNGIKRSRDDARTELGEETTLHPTKKHRRQISDDDRQASLQLAMEEDSLYLRTSPVISSSSNPSSPQRPQSHNSDNPATRIKSPQKQGTTARNKQAVHAPKEYKSPAYVFDSDDDTTNPSAVSHDETLMDPSTPQGSVPKPQRFLPVNLESGARSTSLLQSATKKRIRRKEVVVPTISSDSLRHGPFAEVEKQAIRDFKESYCRCENVSHKEFVAKLHEHAHNNIKSQQFWKEMKEAVADRDIRSLQRFCRRFWPKEGIATGPFLPEDDDELISLVALHGSQWVKIGELMDRNPGVIRDRYRNVLKHRSTRSTQKWTSKEVLDLKHAMGEAGARILEETGQIEGLSKHIFWGSVSDKMHGARGRSQCAYKWKVLRRKGLVSLAEEVQAASIRLGINTGFTLADLEGVSRMLDTSTMSVNGDGESDGSEIVTKEEETSEEEEEVENLRTKNGNDVGREDPDSDQNHVSDHSDHSDRDD